jgi:hypothetical protein
MNGQSRLLRVERLAVLIPEGTWWLLLATIPATFLWVLLLGVWPDAAVTPAPAPAPAPGALPL